MLNIVGALFTDEQEGRKALKALAKTPEINGTKLIQMSLIKRDGGELKLCDNFASDELKSADTVKGGLIGGIIGLLSGPVSALLGGAAGALLGKAVDSGNKSDSKSLIQQVAQKLEEGDIALIMLADEKDEGILDHMLVGYNTLIIRYDADVIVKEVEAAKKAQKEA